LNKLNNLFLLLLLLHFLLGRVESQIKFKHTFRPLKIAP
jgi:hypothetical protein